MSLLFDDNSHNLTGSLEKQHYVPKPMEDLSQDVRLCQLSKVVRQMVTQSVSQLKPPSPEQTHEQRTMNDVIEAVPISFRMPEDCVIDITAMDKAKRRAPTKLVGTLFKSFKQLPEDCPFGAMELDKLPAPQVEDQVTPESNQNARQFSFSERLDGWKIERRQRNNGRYDLYYYHDKSRRMFRSTIEVVNFILYEIYPKQKRKANKVGASEEDYSVGSEKREGTILKRKLTSPSLDSSSKSKEMCFSSEFCEDERTKTSAETTLSSDNDNKSKDDTCFSSYHSEQKTAKEVMEFLDTAYNNLLNFFNEEEEEPQESEENKRKKMEESREVADNGIGALVLESMLEPQKSEENKRKKKKEPREGADDGIGAIVLESMSEPQVSEENKRKKMEEPREVVDDDDVCAIILESMSEPRESEENKRKKKKEEPREVADAGIGALTLESMSEPQETEEKKRKKMEDPREVADDDVRAFLESMSAFLEDLDSDVGSSSSSNCVSKYFKGCDLTLELREQQELIDHIPEETGPEKLAEFLVHNRNQGRVNQSFQD